MQLQCKRDITNTSVIIAIIFVHALMSIYHTVFSKNIIEFTLYDIQNVFTNNLLFLSNGNNSMRAKLSTTTQSLPFDTFWLQYNIMLSVTYHINPIQILFFFFFLISNFIQISFDCRGNSSKIALFLVDGNCSIWIYAI